VLTGGRAVLTAASGAGRLLGPKEPAQLAPNRAAQGPESHPEKDGDENDQRVGGVSAQKTREDVEKNGGRCRSDEKRVPQETRPRAPYPESSHRRAPGRAQEPPEDSCPERPRPSKYEMEAGAQRGSEDQRANRKRTLWFAERLGLFGRARFLVNGFAGHVVRLGLIHVGDAVWR